MLLPFINRAVNQRSAFEEQKAVSFIKYRLDTFLLCGQSSQCSTDRCTAHDRFNVMLINDFKKTLVGMDVALVQRIGVDADLLRNGRNNAFVADEFGEISCPDYFVVKLLQWFQYVLES